MLEVKVPEDIRKHEAKMFFGLTGKQFIIVIIAAAIGIAWYFLTKQAQTAGFVALIISLIGFSNFDKMLKPFFSFINKPRQYVYVKTFDLYSYMLDEEVKSGIQENSNERSKSETRK